eukprot:Skav231570  [mRNA]  locus=scaffold481:208059:208666:- [translate_table: standard]
MVMLWPELSGIRSFTGGFILGGSLGYVAVWESDDGGEGESMKSVDEEYRLSTAAKARVRPEGDAISALDITVGEEQLLLGFGNSDIGIVAMASLYSTEDLARHDWKW